MLQSCGPMAPSHRIHHLESRYNIQTSHFLLNNLQIASQRFYAGEGVHFLCGLSIRVVGASEDL